METYTFLFDRKLIKWCLFEKLDFCMVDKQNGMEGAFKMLKGM